MKLEITREDSPRGGRYVIETPHGEAELVYIRVSPDVVNAVHTGVPDAMSGRGIAGALLNALLDDARRDDFRIIPTCPYVRAQYARHPEWAPLFTTKPGEDI